MLEILRLLAYIMKKFFISVITYSIYRAIVTRWIHYMRKKWRNDVEEVTDFRKKCEQNMNLEQNNNYVEKEKKDEDIFRRIRSDYCSVDCNTCIGWHCYRDIGDIGYRDSKSDYEFY